jgi:hypothetical protein
MKCADFLKVIICILIWTSGIASKNSSQKYFKEKEKEIASHLTLGNYFNALKVCDDLMQTKSVDKDQKYQLLTTKSKIHFWDENLNEFMRSASEAYRLKSKDKEIYRAYYYAQKAAYFHYHMIGDSTVIFMDKSMNILNANRDDMDLIPAYFIYQMYGTSYIYRPNEFRYKSKKESDNIYLSKVFTFMDSALFFLKNHQHFPNEKALVYRSIGSRIMDAAGYNIRNKKSDFSDYPRQMKIINAAIDSYNEGINCLPKTEDNLKRSLFALKALAYYCSNREKLGDELLWPIIKKFSGDPKKHILKSMNSSLYCVQYFTQSLLSKDKYDQRIETVFKIYKQIRPWWLMHNSRFGSKFKDVYGNSPATILLAIYNRIFEWGKIKKLQKDETTELAIESYYVRSQLIEKEILKNNNTKKYFLFLCELEKGIFDSRILNFNKNTLWSSSLIKNIRSKLKKNEAIILRSEGALNVLNYIIITHDDDQIIPEKKISEFENIINEKNPNIFKKKAIKNYALSPFSKYLNTHRNINKLYVANDVKVPFDLMITSNHGVNFSDFCYFKTKINVIQMFNVIDFFYSENRYDIISNKITIHKINKNHIEFPFIENELKKVQGNYNLKYSDDVKRIFEREGFAHVLGHSTFYNGESIYFNSISILRSRKSIECVSKIKSDVFILNTCFASVHRWPFISNRDFQNNLISRGAKGVIASPFETVDQSSAYIFKQFYNYIFNGKTVEDALQLAKLDYLKTHKGSLAHPMYWSTYELTSNVKDLRMKLEVKEHGNNQYLVLLLFASIFLITIIFFRLLIEKFI